MNLQNHKLYNQSFIARSKIYLIKDVEGVYVVWVKKRTKFDSWPHISRDYAFVQKINRRWMHFILVIVIAGRYRLDFMPCRAKLCPFLSLMFPSFFKCWLCRNVCKTYRKIVVIWRRFTKDYNFLCIFEKLMLLG